MGVTHFTARLSSPSGAGAPFEAESLVDTGAVDCLVPADKLAAAGVTPEKKSVYELADGTPVEYDCGFAGVSCLGEETVTQVIFGPARAEPIVGVVALENVGVVVDPVSKTLKRLRAGPLEAVFAG
jgi:clan AA aspartic protease